MIGDWVVTPPETRTAATVVRLYEDNDGGLYLRRDDGPLWALGVPPHDRVSDFRDDAQAWAEDQWQPSEDDGQRPVDDDDDDGDLAPVAYWTPAQGVRLIAEPWFLGASAELYLYGRRR